MAEQSEADYLRHYDRRAFDAPLVTVDIAILSVREGQLQVLLVRRDEHPARGRWALPGGFIALDRDPDLESAARRKLAEETGVDTSYLEQVFTVGGRDRDPRGWSVTVLFFALIASEHIALRHGKGTSDAAWFPLQGAAVEPALAFDHAQLLSAAVERLRNKVEYTALPVHLMPPRFTLRELQQVFEIVLGHEINKAAFRRRINEAGILDEVPGELRRGSNRPAQLYRVRRGKGEYFFERTFGRGS